MPAFAAKPQVVALKKPPQVVVVAGAVVNFLKGAIEHRVQIYLDYPPGRRILEPHALGLSADGNYLLRAWQTEGESESGEHVNWKLLRLDKISGPFGLGPTFKVRHTEGYKQGDRCMKGGIIAQV